ncbi:hypothetical protein DFH28DRAFT_940409 [Melampsora americana]|nr:hypothetical protein DFH28DRAFT_940409 [Melampsora americana]
MTPGATSGPKGKKQGGGTKQKASDSMSHMDPELAPARDKYQGRQDSAPVRPSPGESTPPSKRIIPASESAGQNEVDTSDKPEAEAKEDHNDQEDEAVTREAHMECEEKDDNGKEADEALVPADGAAADPNSVLQSLSFKKKGKEEEIDEKNMSEKQKVRAVKIKEARQQYDAVRAIHDELSKSIKQLEERAKGGAIDKSVYILKRTCNKINQEMTEKEEELLMALTSDHPDVIFVPMVFDPSAAPVARTPIDLDSSPPASQSNEGHPVVKAAKRKENSVEPVPEAGKKRKKMKASDYILDEAKESNTEASKEVLGKRPARRAPYKSPKFVDPEDMEPEDEGDKGGSVVHAADLGKGKNKGGKEPVMEEDDLESVPELYRKAMKPDLSKLLKDPTKEEISEMRNFRESMTSHQFNYGEALAPSVCNVINTWNFDDDTLDDKIEPDDLAPHINYMMELIDDHSLMTRRLQTAPRLMQVSAKDPFLNEDSLDWSVLEDSAKYPYKFRNGVFRSLQAMLCRTSTSPDWTDDAILKGHIRSGYSILHNILAESVEHISFDSIHDSIVIQTEGDFAVPKQFVGMSQTIGWVFQQIAARTRSEGSKRVDRVGSASIGSLQKQFFLVMLGVMLVYESEMYNSFVDRLQRSKKTSAEITLLKTFAKDTSVLKQLINTKLSFGNKRHRTITSTDPDAPNTSSAHASSRPIIKSVKPPQLTDSEKKERRQIQNKVNHDASEMRREAIQHMALFFMYGTASFFHVWPAARDQTMQDAASLVNLASILSERRWASVGEQMHVYGARAWNRLDDLMYDALKKFVSNGNFITRIDWPTMTSYFSQNFEATRLANVFTLDMLSEIHVPGLSRGLNGLVQEQVDLPEKESWLMNAPATESFRALWGPTEGPLKPVTDRGKSLYPEVDINTRSFAKQPNADSIMSSDQAKSNSKGNGGKENDDGDKGNESDRSD